MSWMQKLYDTYEQCYGNSLFMTSEHILMPVSHTSQNVNIRVTLDREGNFRDAELLGKEAFVIPATENSAGRTSSTLAPHPLIDKIQYCAGDYSKYGGKKKEGFSKYEELLRDWVNSEWSHPKIRAVYTYINKKQLVKDLVNKGILELDGGGILTLEPRLADKPGLFKYLTGKKEKGDDSSKRDQGDALVCWSVEGLGVGTDTWHDPEIQQLWINYDKQQMSKYALCMITGKNAPIPKQHPRNIRRPGDGAKLISSNDESGFTFRGKFDLSDEACSAGYESSHKAHNALRWLIARQGSRHGEQVILAWAVNGHEIPNPVEDDWLIKPTQGAFVPEVEKYEEADVTHISDIGQSFSIAVGKALAGYKVTLKPTDEIVILGLDAATPGRLSVIFYREMQRDNYLEKLQAWQEDCAWLLRRKVTKEVNSKSKEEIFYSHCAPTPREIASAAYGPRVDDKLSAATRERLLPCIADRSPLPIDLVNSTVRRACNKSGLEAWDWEQTMAVTCALYRGFYARHTDLKERRTYAMTLESERKSRDYLFGRLLAVAERIEYVALRIANEKRPTNAERLMQRFADHPLTTWKTLETAIQPYRQRLLQNRAGFLTNMDKLLDEIMSLFEANDFVADSPLSGEYLLGYHCQRQELWNKEKAENTNSNETTEGEEQ